MNTFGPTGLLSRIVSPTVYYVFDPQGSVASRLNGSQTVLSSDQYDAYGNRWQGDTSDVFAYGAQAGYYRDTETGVLLLTNRYYDPRDGRFLTRDPVEYEGGINLYGYVGGNPVNWVDPDGLGKVKLLIRLVDLLANGVMRTRRVVHCVGEAQRIRRRGGNVLVTADRLRDARRTAEQIEKGVPGKTLRHGPHPKAGKRALPHCQTNGVLGHTFYKRIPIVIPFADLGDRAGGGVVGGIVDFLNPLNDIQTVIDAVNDPRSLLGEGTE